MDINFFIKGIILGFSIAAPVGPIGILCIRKTLAEGRLSGFVTGFGAATADAVYGFFAAFGLSSITTFLVGQHSWIQLIGGAFLLYLGIKTLFEKVSTKQAEVETKKGLIASYISTLGLTLTNPMTILSFVAVFAGLGIGNEAESYTSATLLVIGVFLGSALWWIFLSGIVGLFKKKVNT
jgi:threonine/homoserine/homoserine lactone efflux protein